MGVEFKHHYALDDAETCAKIVLEAAKGKKVLTVCQTAEGYRCTIRTIY